MPKNFLGIDIGSCYIKAANVALKKNCIVLSKPFIIRTPELLGQIPDNSDFKVIAKLIKEKLSEYGIKTKKAAVVINDSMVITRDLELPASRSKELEKMIKLHASEYLPNDVEDYTIRFKTFESAKQDSNKMGYVLTASVKSDIVKDLYYAIADIGLKPCGFDVSINSMIKYMRHMYLNNIQKNDKSKISAIIDLGAASSKVVIMQGKIPVFQQIIGYGSQRLDVLISNALNVERVEAEKMKKSYGINHLYDNSDGRHAMEVSTIVRNQIDLILNEIYKLLQNFSDRNPSLPVSSIWLAGGASRMEGLDKYVQNVISIPCNVVKTDKCIEIQTDKTRDTEHIKITHEDLPYFSSIIGAVLRGG